MEATKWKVVHEEVYYSFRMVVKAQFRNEPMVEVNGLRYTGNIELRYIIYNSDNQIIAEYSRFDDWLRSGDYEKYCISFKKRIIRYGFLKLKRKEELIHIKDEYLRVLPLFIEKAKDNIKNEINKELQINANNKITDGLADSLDNLRGRI